MKAIIRCALVVVTLALIAPSPFAQAQGNVPSDLEVTASAGGTRPWSEISTVRIQANGEGHFARYVAGDAGSPPLEENSFSLTDVQLAQVWQALDANGFFSLQDDYRDSDVSGGSFARLLVRANGIVHAVTVENAALEAIEHILSAINSATPSGNDVLYVPPEHFEVVPRDVCEQGGKTAGSVDLSLFKDKSGQPGRPASKVGAPVSGSNGEGAHAGTTVAYHMSLEDAVNRGIVQLEGKGDFFGDQVSITADNSGNETSDELVATLYMEFWGPNATAANVQRIKNAIETTWSGKQTSDGKTLKLEVKTRVTAGGTQPPGTAGYHQIRLVGETTSFVSGFGSFGVNDGTGGGTWATAGDNLDATYAHEAGHLMGFDDRYEDFEKQPDGTWKKVEGDETLSSEELADKLKASNPDKTAEQLKDWLDMPDNMRATAPLPGYEDDLMADLDGQVQQEYIDTLANQAGLMIEVRPGDILVNKDGDEQNFAIIRSEDIFVPPGGVKTLEGLYTACIDAAKGSPSQGQAFDVTLGLETWRGIEAAPLLLQLVRYIDENELFCEYDTQSQLAIWRITDNSMFGSFLLEQAGISVGDRALDFPRLSNPDADRPGSTLLIPFELFVPAVVPARTLAAVGSTVSLSGNLASPEHDGLSAGTSWFLQPPPGSSAALSVQNGGVSLMLDERGFYEIGFNVTTSGAMAVDTTFARSGARVVAWDQQTDRFERAAVQSHAFPWTTSGAAPWTITNEDAHTGAFSAVSGSIEDEQESVLEITFSLPEEGNVAFAYRTSSEADFDVLTFQINGVEYGNWSGDVDWSTATYPVPPGETTLRWTYSKDESFAGGLDRAWLDDVFIPRTAVGVSIGSETPLPLEYDLSQNYPNPFNPATTISFSLADPGPVALKIFDALGREVAVLVSGEYPAGRFEAVWDATGFPSGTYFYRLETDRFVDTKTLVLIK